MLKPGPQGVCGYSAGGGSTLPCFDPMGVHLQSESRNGNAMQQAVLHHHYSIVYLYYIPTL